MTELQMGDDWERYENSTYRWSSIKMREVVYSDLPTGAEDVIRDLVETRDCNGKRMERVQRLNPQTIELVWYDDVDTDDGPTEVSNYILRSVQRVLTQFFGEHWRVSRKRDERRRDNEHPQRAVVRRAESQRFQYTDESHEGYLEMLHGRPEGLPSDVSRWGDYAPYEQPPEAQGVHDVRDVYIRETSTGTRHIIRGYALRTPHFTSDVKTECGRTVSPDDLTAFEGITHLATHVLIDTGEDPNPKAVFDEDLCGACWTSYQRVSKKTDGSVLRRLPPSNDYVDLLDWTIRPEVAR